MDPEKLLTSCQAILEQFDRLGHKGQFEGPNAFEMAYFWMGLSGFDEITKDMGGDLFGKWTDAIDNFGALCFAFGFVLGRTVDLVSQDIAEDIEVIKETIREGEFFYHSSRKKKTD